jgi:hypothetical protein
MATNKTTKKAKAADSGILNYTGQGRTATEVKLPKLDPKAKQHHILFEMGKNDVKAELDKKIKPVSIACKRTKAKQVCMKPFLPCVYTLPSSHARRHSTILSVVCSERPYGGSL